MVVKLIDDVIEKVKFECLVVVFVVIELICKVRLVKYVDQVVEIVVEGFSKKLCWEGVEFQMMG